MVRILCLAALVPLLASFEPAPVSPAAALPQDASAFVGAEACRECHAAYNQAWSTTKHARALNQLSRADRTSGRCIRCHVTDTAEMMAAQNDSPKFPDVQCEACHGAGRPHVEAARAGNAAAAKTRRISEQTCTRCHSTESPNYKTFIFNALKTLVHRVE